MALFLSQVAYNPEAWNALLKNPHNRFEAIRPAIDSLGGKLLHGWFAFGEYDVVAIMEMPTNVEAAAIAVAFAAGGACKAIKTTPLMTAAEGIEIMKKAATCGYRPVTAAAAAGR